MRTLPSALCLAGLALWNGCGSGDDEENAAPVEQALVAQVDWSFGANPGLNDQPRGRLNWFPLAQPLTQHEIQPGWPHNEPVQVLALAHQPFAFLAGSTIHYNPTSWSTFASRVALDTLTTVLEWKMRYVDVPSAGTLVIDVGEFSEDIWPNGRMDTEDTNSDLQLLPSEDTGLDNQASTDMPWPMPVDRMSWSGSVEEMQAAWGAAYDWQDLDNDDVRQASEPWSWDDWSAADEANPFAGNPCGQEGNGVLDTEDLDGDQVLDTADNFYRYVLPIDPAAPTQDAAITQLNDSEWLQLSLQLARDHQTVGTPDFSRPVHVRITLQGFEGPTLIYATWFDWR